MILTNETIFSYTVPLGKILYLNAAQVTILEAWDGGGYISIPDKTFNYSIAVNGSTEVYNQDITVEPISGFNPVSAIVEPGSILEIKVTLDYSTVTTPPTGLRFLTHLQGDMIAPNDLPTPYTALQIPKGLNNG